MLGGGFHLHPSPPERSSPKQASCRLLIPSSAWRSMWVLTRLFTTRSSLTRRCRDRHTGRYPSPSWRRCLRNHIRGRTRTDARRGRQYLALPAVAWSPFSGWNGRRRIGRRTVGSARRKRFAYQDLFRLATSVETWHGGRASSTCQFDGLGVTCSWCIKNVVASAQTPRYFERLPAAWPESASTRSSTGL